MKDLRQLIGGLLAAALLTCTVAGSTLIAFAEFGASAAGRATGETPATPTATLQPATATFVIHPTSTTHGVPPTIVPTRTQAVPPTLPPTPTQTPAVPPTATALAPASTATKPPPTIALATPTALRPTACAPSPPSGWVFYTIKPGDTLFGLSQRWGVSLSTLQRVNCIADPADIKAGQRIHAPPIAAATLTPAATPTEALPPGDVATITSVPVPTATADCPPPEFYDPALGRCRLPDPTATSGS